MLGQRKSPDIHELVDIGALPERLSYRERFQLLREKHYDVNTGLWHREGKRAFVEDQILAALAAHAAGIEDAANSLARLRTSIFKRPPPADGSPYRGAWHSASPDGVTIIPGIIKGFEEVAGLLLEASANTPTATEHYHALRESELYSKNLMLWRTGISSSTGAVVGAGEDSSTQLLDVLVVDALGGDAQYAFSRIEAEFLDDQTREWRRKNVMETTPRSTSNQLFGVLARATIDVPAAREEYRRLRRSSYLNAAEDRWFSAFGCDDPIPGRLVTELADILVGARLDSGFEATDAPPAPLVLDLH